MSLSQWGCPITLGSFIGSCWFICSFVIGSGKKTIRKGLLEKLLEKKNGFIVLKRNTYEKNKPLTSFGSGQLI